MSYGGRVYRSPMLYYQQVRICDKYVEKPSVSSSQVSLPLASDIFIKMPCGHKFERSQTNLLDFPHLPTPLSEFFFSLRKYCFLFLFFSTGPPSSQLTKVFFSIAFMLHLAGHHSIYHQVFRLMLLQYRSIHSFSRDYVLGDGCHCM